MREYNIADHSESEKIAQKMKASVHKLRKLAPQVGAAKQCKEFTSDRKKNLLAKYMLSAIKAGETGVAAETIARANEAYQTELEALSKQHEAAERTIAEWSAENCAYEAARSLLSFSKETLRQIE